MGWLPGLSLKVWLLSAQSTGIVLAMAEAQENKSAMSMLVVLGRAEI